MWGQDILIKMKTIKEKEWGKEEKWRKNAQKKEEMKTTFLSCKLKCACENKVCCKNLKDVRSVQQSLLLHIFQSTM